VSLCWLFIACSTYSLFVFVNFVCGFSLTHGMNWRLIFFYVIVTMYVCYICGTASFSIPKFRSHLHRHQDLAEIKLPILCLQGNCTSSFNRIYNFMRHLDSFHASQTEARLVGSKSFSDSTAERERQRIYLQRKQQNMISLTKYRTISVWSVPTVVWMMFGKKEYPSWHHCVLTAVFHIMLYHTL